VYGWDPTHETQRAFKDRVNGLLGQYLEEVAALASERGLVLAPVKRELEHFEWLARFQVGGESFLQIGASGVSISAVEQAVRRTAKTIGLALRPLPRSGRPRARVEIFVRGTKSRH
jgi:hypothetical protein